METPKCPKCSEPLYCLRCGEPAGATSEERYQMRVAAFECRVCKYPGPRGMCLGAPRDCHDGDNGVWKYQDRSEVRKGRWCEYFGERPAAERRT
jgi:hypothetical protein